MSKVSFYNCLLVCFLFLCLGCGCSLNEDNEYELIDVYGTTSEVDSLNFKLGIPLYNADQGKEFWTEFNTQIRPFWKDEAKAELQRPFFKNNPYLECVAVGGVGEFGVRLSLFGTLFDDYELPEKISNRVKGLSFNAVANQEATLDVKVLDTRGEIIKQAYFELESFTFKTYSLQFDPESAKEVIFSCVSAGTEDSIRFGLDDILLKTKDAQIFQPPASDAAFLSWLKQAAFNFFDWNFVDLSNEKGVLLESSTDTDKVSLSGLGYAYAIYILGAEEGFISKETAKYRVRSMLNWQMQQNWFDGTGGWHGFPHHYFKKDGSYYWADVSMIDWAICAAGIRVVRQYYKDDAELVAIADALLSRPDWTAALAEEDKIAMGFDGYTGEMNDFRWGLAFSEETELVYLEAVASGDLESGIFDAIIREEKNNFYPSWFGAGFTYNWLQLWTGVMEPFKANSEVAFNIDAVTSQRAFGLPLMGLTACSTVKETRERGFLSWGRYISNQGGNVHGASLGSVIQISPAPYGAALALPFTYERAMTALRTYVALGFYHEHLGLPDNVRVKNLPNAYPPSPNWSAFDINIGPQFLAIEQIQDNRIAKLYLSDPSIQETLSSLIDSFD